MKTRSKALLLTLCAVLLVAASVLGTMAYLTADDQVVNTFTVGKVEITLDEAKVNLAGEPVDKDGNVVNLTDAPRVAENKYHLLPGHEYDKDPIIHVDSESEDCYLFVTINNAITDIEALGNTVAEQMAVKGWQVVDSNAGLYVYVGTTEDATAPLAVTKNSNIAVFEKIEIAGSVDNITLEDYEDATITVTAYAVQKDGFENKTAADIWKATFGASAEG